MSLYSTSFCSVGSADAHIEKPVISIHFASECKLSLTLNLKKTRCWEHNCAFAHVVRVICMRCSVAKRGCFNRLFLIKACTRQCCCQSRAPDPYLYIFDVSRHQNQAVKLRCLQHLCAAVGRGRVRARWKLSASPSPFREPWGYCIRGVDGRITASQEFSSSGKWGWGPALPAERSEFSKLNVVVLFISPYHFPSSVKGHFIWT